MSFTPRNSALFTIEPENLTSAVVSTYVLPFTEAWVIVSTFILVVFLVFGVTANSVTITVINTSPRLKYSLDFFNVLHYKQSFEHFKSIVDHPEDSFNTPSIIFYIIRHDTVDFAESVNIAERRSNKLFGLNRYYTMLSSLCVSDIFSALISVLFLYRRIWGFLYFAWPAFFCRLYWGVDLWTSFSTAMHILSFAILRLIGVRWPTRFQQITKNYMRIWIASIWLITFICGFIPHFLFNTVREIDRENPNESRWASCSLAPKWIPTWQIYVQVVYTFFLFGPALAIIAISITIAVLLRRRTPPGQKNSAPFVSVSKVVDNRQMSKVVTNSPAFVRTSPKLSSGYGSAPGTPVSQYTKQRRTLSRETAFERRKRKDKQAVVQLFLIVGSFLLGYIPLTAFHFYTGFTLNDSSPEINAFDWRFAMVQYILLRFSECLNPVFYNLASKKMRDETKNVLRKLLRISKTYSGPNRNTHRRQTGTSSDI